MSFMQAMRTPSAQEVEAVITTLHHAYPDHPMHTAFGHNPFHMLVAVILSQRATDAQTIPVARTLLNAAPTPQALLTLQTETLETIIRPIGFFHTKTRALQKLAHALINTHAGQVPSTERDLLALPQVGRKTANIILTMFFATPQIAVDTHVHRISNRLGWISTKTAEETEKQLTRFVPKQLVSIINQIFVRHGQEICRPIRPWCSRCPVAKYCKRIDVVSSR